MDNNTETPEVKKDYSGNIILVVDDEISILKFLETLLRKNFNVEVMTASNPKEAFDILKTIKPSIIIMDMQMPVMDGFTAIKYLRKIQTTRDIPIIACTALSSKDLLMGLHQQKVKDFMLKPLTKKIVLDHVGRLLRDLRFEQKHNDRKEKQSGA